MSLGTINVVRFKIGRCLVMRKLNKLSFTLFVLVIVWPFVGTNCQNTLRAQAPLFDSVDENFNPVSMGDLIDGKPLILAVSSCT